MTSVFKKNRIAPHDLKIYLTTGYVPFTLPGGCCWMHPWTSSSL